MIVETIVKGDWVVEKDWRIGSIEESQIDSTRSSTTLKSSWDKTSCSKRNHQDWEIKIRSRRMTIDATWRIQKLIMAQWPKAEGIGLTAKTRRREEKEGIWAGDENMNRKRKRRIT